MSRDLRLPGRFRSILVLFGLFLVFPSLMTGCGKKHAAEFAVAEEIAPPATEPGPSPLVDQTAAQPRKLEVPEGANTDAVLQQMNRELIRWVVGHRRRPASFEEFVSSARLTVPPPPAGKHYEISKEMKVVLK